MQNIHAIVHRFPTHGSKYPPYKLWYHLLGTSYTCLWFLPDMKWALIAGLGRMGRSLNSSGRT